MDSFIGEIRILPYEYAPEDWAWCDGATLKASQAQALFAVIGQTFGGSGQTFCLPNLAPAAGSTNPGSAPMGAGAGPGLTPRVLGPKSLGTAAISLSLDQVPAHNHTFTTQNTTIPDNILPNPENNWLARGTVNFPSPKADSGFFSYAPYDESKRVTFREPALTSAGSGQAHNNLQPYLAMNFCISLQGQFPVQD